MADIAGAAGTAHSNTDDPGTGTFFAVCNDSTTGGQHRSLTGNVGRHDEPVVAGDYLLGIKLAINIQEAGED